MTTPRSSVQILKLSTASATEIAQTFPIASGKIGAPLPEQQAAGFSLFALFDPSIKLIDGYCAKEPV